MTYRAPTHRLAALSFMGFAAACGSTPEHAGASGNTIASAGGASTIGGTWPGAVSYAAAGEGRASSATAVPTMGGAASLGGAPVVATGGLGLAGTKEPGGALGGGGNRAIPSGGGRDSANGASGTGRGGTTASFAGARSATGGAVAAGNRGSGGTGLAGRGSSIGTSSGGRGSGGLSRESGGTTASRGGASATAGSGGCLDGPALLVPEGYSLVWSEEFNQDGAPDPKNWGFESGFVRNEEAQYYQPDNATVQKGCLIIEGRRERVSNPSYKAGSSDWKTSRQYAEYTSSSLRTMGKHSWQYGRFEMRGRIRTEAGLWPAWWTLGNDGEWPSCGEIDIMEYYANNVRANIACGTSTRWQAKWDSVAWDATKFDDQNWQDKFHLWRMDWDSQKIDLYLDDKLVNTANLSSLLNPDGSSPFKQEHYMILNLAIGGQNGGDPGKTPFPSRFEVDYVRVFKQQ